MMFRPFSLPRKNVSTARTQSPRRCIEPLEGRVLFAAGDLDTSFGSGGFARADFGNATEVAGDVAVDAGRGRILVSGNVGFGDAARVGLAAFKLDGKPDTTFSGDGKLLTNLGWGGQLAVLPDGRFYVSGNNAPGGNTPTLSRFNPNGSLDTSFSGDGKLTLPSFGHIAVVPGGKVVNISGPNDLGRPVTVTRYNSNGSLDSTLGGDGSVSLTFGVGDYHWTAVAAIDIAPDGKMVIAGTVHSEFTDWDGAVVRLNTNGTYDRSFDGDGRKIFNLGYIDDFATAVAVAPNNDVLVGVIEGEREAYVYRLSPSGSVVPFANPHVRGETARVRSIEVAPDGKVVIAGTYESDPFGEINHTTFLHRVKPGGGLDPDFGGYRTGRTIHPVGSRIAIDPAGNILVVDHTNTNDVSVARYRNAGGENAAGVVTGSNGQITVTGTTRGDEIRVDPSSGGKIDVTVNGYRRQYTASTISRIVVNAGNGDDDVRIGSAIRLPATLSGGAGIDTLIGGAGNDRIDGGDNGSLGDRVESVIGGLGNDTLLGGNGTDYLVGGDGNDRLEGGAGRDNLDGGRGADYLSGGADLDTLNYTTRTAGLTITLGNTADDGEAGERDNARDDLELVLGGSGNDRIVGTSAANYLYGYAGSDTLHGGAGNDDLYGGDGNDLLEGQDGNDGLHGMEGNDTLRGGNGDDLLNDTGPADVYDGGPGSDTINGHREDNVPTTGPVRIDPNDGTIYVQGSDAADQIRAVYEPSASEGVLRVQFTSGADPSASRTVLFPISIVRRINVEAGDGADVIDLTYIPIAAFVEGRGGNDAIYSGEANDVLRGGDGNDSIHGRGGNDTLDGQGGADTMNGGEGTDTVDYSSRTRPVNVSLTNTADDGEVGERDNANSDIENILGGSGDDNLIGSSANNRIDGGAGNDVIIGNRGRDQLYGRAGNDSFSARGDSAIDFIDGGSGTDTAFKDPDDFAQYVEQFPT